MIIGNFTYDRTRDTYTGEVATLTLAARKVAFQPSEARGDKAPSHRIVSPGKTGSVEFGAAWKKRSEKGRDYLSVRLDDSALSQPLNCALVEASDGEAADGDQYQGPGEKPRRGLRRENRTTRNGRGCARTPARRWRTATAEIAEKQARSLKCQMTIARLSLAKDIVEFDFCARARRTFVGCAGSNTEGYATNIP